MSGEALEIGVVGADDEAGMFEAIVVQTAKVHTILGDEDSVVPVGELQSRVVGDSGVRVTGFEGSKHVMSETPQDKNRCLREVLVRVQPRHPGVRQASSALAWMAWSISSRFALA